MTGRRVLLLFPHVTLPGGALNYTARLAAELRAAGAVVALLTLRAERELLAPFAGTEVISLDGPVTSSLHYWLLFPLWQRRLEERIDAWRPDVLVPQVFPANWWGWLYRRRQPGTPLVWVCQEPSAFIHSAAWIRALTPRWKGLLARLLRPALARIDLSLARGSTAVIANSRYTAAEVERVYGRVPDAIASPGIVLVEGPVPLAPKGRSVLTVARLTRFKRIDFLLDVFAGMLQHHPDLTYHIVGSGEEEGALRDQAERLGLMERVVFHGPLDDPALRLLYRDASLFLHGAIGEPFGMAPLEAIAAGTPVVAHHSGGVAEFVNERCGALIDSTDSREWADHAARLIVRLSTDDRFRSGIRECALPYRWSETLRPALRLIAAAADPAGERHGRERTP